MQETRQLMYTVPAKETLPRGRAWCSSNGLVLLIHGQARLAQIITEVVLVVEQSRGQK